MHDWDGIDRRNVNTEERDLLIKIDTRLSDHITIMAEYIRENNLKITDVKRDLMFNNKILYGALGIIAFLEFLGKFK